MTFIVLVMASAAAIAVGAAPATGPAPEQRSLAATRAWGSVRVDGRLDEADWSRAEVARDFVQAEPRQGQLAAEPTEVRVLFDDHSLYLGVICHDSKGARGPRVRDLRRDFDETTDDFFGVALDGFGDGRGALVFRVNSMGALRDQQALDGSPVDVDFDAAWTARTNRGTGGWTAEIAIPWTTLRYRRDASTWGINFQRVRRRGNETSGWSPWPRAAAPYRMDYAGVLIRIEPPPPRRHLRVTPYLLGEVASSGAPGAATGVKTGADAKWALGPGTVLDLTANPDFGQAEVDRQLVNLTRFSPFFPERRPFFLENRSLFFSGNGQRFEPFFSRRIGLNERGEPIPITAGVRLSARSPQRGLGALFVSQRGSGAGPGSRFGVARYFASLGGQNRVGALVAARLDDGGPSNLVGGLDWFWRFGRTAFIRGTVTSSTTSGPGGEGVGAFFWLANEAGWGYLGYVGELVTAGFDARAGFVVRTDYVRVSPAATLDWRPSWRPAVVRRLRPGFTVEHFLSASSLRVQEGFVSMRPLVAELHNGGVVQYTLQPAWQRPAAAFRPLPGVEIAPGAYDTLRHSLSVQTDPSARLALRLEGSTGGYFDGCLHTARGVLQATPDPRLALSADYSVNRLTGVGVSASSLTAHLLGVETRLAVNPRLQLVVFAQWNSSAGQLAGNVRLVWEHRPLGALAVVYNHRAAMRGLAEAPATTPDSRQLLVKLTLPVQR